MTRRSAAAVLGITSVVIVALSVAEWTSEGLRPFADALQWTLFAAVLIGAREVVKRFHRSESKLRALVGSLDDVIFILGRDGTYIEVPPTNPALLYKPLNEIVGSRIHDIFPTETADRFVAEIERAIAAEGPVSFDYMLSINDKDVWFNASVTALTDETVLWVARDITERKNTEIELERRVKERTNALQRSEQRYRGVFEQAAEIIFTLSLDGAITSINPAFERILGWSCDEWVGRTFEGLIAPDLRQRIPEIFDTLRRSGKIEMMRTATVHRNGSRVTLEVSASRKVAGDRVIGFIGVARDVTDRERAERELRRSERQLAEAQAIARVGSWEHDLVRGTMWWSAEAFRMFGADVRHGAMSFDELLQIVRTDDRPVIGEFRDALLVKGSHSAEMELMTANGEKRSFAVRGRLLRDANGLAARTVGTLQDVTEQRLAEQKLRESEERFRLATLATTEAIWDLDLTSGTSWHSEGYAQFGYDAEFVQNAAGWWIERIHSDDRERVLAIRNEAWESGQESWSGEYRLRRADGTYAHVLHRALVLRDEQKRPVRVVGALLDLTEHKQLVDQLEQAKRVTSLGRVAAAIAHEFNNVLMGIQPNVEVIQRSSPPALRSVTESITHAVQRGKRVTDEILRFTRPAEPNVQPVEVAPFLAKWREEIAPLLGPAVALQIEVADPDLHVAADPAQLAQIFTNLALNGRDAMQNGGGRLAVSARLSKSFGAPPFAAIETPDRFVHFAVVDEGCGISADRLAHIFEPLFTTKRGGIGLGLSVTYQMVSGHGGHIFVDSETGRGSTFHVFVPAALPAAVAKAAPPESSIPSIRRLLLVEDEPSVAAGIAMLLDMEGIQVTTVHNGREAIPAIEEHEPDAVILDVGLPDVDGVTVYLDIQRRWPALPVLFSTGHGDSAALESHLAKPNVGFVFKPYDFEALRQALATVVSAPRATAEAS